MPKSRQSAILWGAALAAATIISFANPDPAYAQNLESFATKVRGLLSSTLLRTLAVIAVIVTGLLWFRRQEVAIRIANGDKIAIIQVRNQQAQRVREVTQEQVLQRDGRSR